MSEVKSVVVTGGAGYVGSTLVPKLLAEGYFVKVLDLYLYGKSSLEGVRGHPCLEEIKGDIRDKDLLERIIPGSDAIIHLACISNDPSFELNPNLGRSINFDAFEPLVEIAKKHAVSRFIYASSSSVYGIKKEREVSEDLPLEPLTDYSKYKALCEDILMKHREPEFNTLIIRPATVCGYSSRLRLDVIVNILTNHAYHNREVKVFGGKQLRPNIHIEDMARLYVNVLSLPSKIIDGKVYNAGYENYSVLDIAKMVQKNVGEDVKLTVVPTDDLRSYHISSDKIKKELNFVPRYTISDAIASLVTAFKEKKVPNSFEEAKYFNIKTMQNLNLV